MKQLIEKLDDKIVATILLCAIALSLWQNVLMIFDFGIGDVFEQMLNNLHYGLSAINLVLYILLLIGLVVYFISHSHNRLLRFVLAILLFVNVISLLHKIISIALEFSTYLEYYRTADMVEMLLIAWNLIQPLMLGFAFYLVILYLSQNTKVVYDGLQIKESSKWKRLVNYLIDSFIIYSFILIILISFFMGSLSMMGNSLIGITIDFLDGISGSMEEIIILLAVALLVLLVISRLLYYLFFELLLSTTPAKYLTGTRLATELGDEAPLASRAIRAICRFIPFNPFSFLGTRGWHDSLSGTRVVDEENGES